MVGVWIVGYRVKRSLVSEQLENTVDGDGRKLTTLTSRRVRYGGIIMIVVRQSHSLNGLAALLLFALPCISAPCPAVFCAESKTTRTTLREWLAALL